MTALQFDIVLMQRIEKIKAILGVKAQEYTTDDDKLHNFRQGQQLENDLTGQHRTIPQICWGYLLKHLSSVKAMIDNPDLGGYKRAEMIDEKVGDAINYLILLEAIFREEMGC